MEPKAKTLQERFGFSDPDLKTPKHDTIMMWLDGEMASILTREVEGIPWKFWPSLVLSRLMPDGSQEELERFGSGSSQFRSLFTNADAMADTYIETTKVAIARELNLPSTSALSFSKVWEKPIMDRTFTIGFADMLTRFDYQFVSCKFVAQTDLRTVISFKHIGNEVSTPRALRHGAFFEVKPTIPSVGELIRQLRMYQTYTGDAKWHVVSPDNRFESVIREQGFGFVRVPGGIS